MIDKIYFDLDMTLADFNEGLIRLCNIMPMDQQIRSEEYDSMLWDRVRRVDHFYDMLIPLDEGLKLFKILYEKYGDKCEILSAIPKPYRGVVNAREDKLSWVKRNISDTIKVNIVMREEKKSYANCKGSVLIDDLMKNILEWEVSGGTGILFTNAAEVLERIEKLEN